MQHHHRDGRRVIADYECGQPERSMPSYHANTAEGSQGRTEAANTLQGGSRAEQTFPGNSGPDRPEECGRDPPIVTHKHNARSGAHTCRREPRQRQWPPWRERPLRTGAGPHRTCVAGSLTPWFPALISAPVHALGGKERRPHGEPSARSLRKSCAANRLRPSTAIAGGVAEDLSATVVSATQGDDLNFRGRPPGRPLLWVSGDVDQGGEMHVLPRQLDAFDPSVFPVDGVGHDRGTGHPERVPGIVQPLLVEGSIPRRAEGAGGVEVASISGRGTRFGEPLPFREQPLQRLHDRRM